MAEVRIESVVPIALALALAILLRIAGIEVPPLPFCLDPGCSCPPEVATATPSNAPCPSGATRVSLTALPPRPQPLPA